MTDNQLGHLKLFWLIKHAICFLKSNTEFWTLDLLVLKGEKVQMTKLVNSYFVNQIEDLINLILSSEINPPL